MFQQSPNVGFQQPQTFGFNQQQTPQPGAFGQPQQQTFGFNQQPAATGFGQPMGYQQPAAGYGHPQQQPGQFGFQQPAANFQQPTTNFQQPAQQFGQPAQPFGQPAATTFGQPAAPAYGQPTTTFGQQPATTFGQQPQNTFGATNAAAAAANHTLKLSQQPFCIAQSQQFGAVGCLDGTLLIYDFSTGACQSVKFPAPILCVDFRQQEVVIGTQQGVFLCHIGTGQQRPLLQGYQYPVTSAHFISEKYVALCFVQFDQNNMVAMKKKKSSYASNANRWAAPNTPQMDAIKYTVIIVDMDSNSQAAEIQDMVCNGHFQFVGSEEQQSTATRNSYKSSYSSTNLGKFYIPQLLEYCDGDQLVKCYDVSLSGSTIRTSINSSSNFTPTKSQEYQQKGAICGYRFIGKEGSLKSNYHIISHENGDIMVFPSSGSSYTSSYNRYDTSANQNIRTLFQFNLRVNCICYLEGIVYFGLQTGVVGMINLMSGELGQLQQAQGEVNILHALRVPNGPKQLVIGTGNLQNLSQNVGVLSLVVIP